MARFEVCGGKAGEDRRRSVSSNGRTIVTSGEGYRAKRECQDGIDLIKRQAPPARVEEQA